MRFDPARALLGSLVGLALALAGVPALLPQEAAPGLVRGVVVDSAGYAIPEARVVLFAEREGRLHGETLTDEHGEFRFTLVPPHPRVFVRAPADSGRLDAFGPCAEDCGALQTFVLHRARPLEVRVRDAAGAPVAGAEVRVYEERTEAAAIALARSDDAGLARLGAPPRAHVAVAAPTGGLFSWRFDLEVPENGTALDVTLAATTELRGRLLAEGEPAAGLELCLWQADEPEGWIGAATSAADGSFLLPRTAGPLTLRVVDPLGRFLPARHELAPEDPGELELGVARGEPQIVRVSRRGLPLVARVFAWSAESRTFGYGARTSGAGRIALPVGERVSLHAAPLDLALEPIEVFDLARTPLELRLEPGRAP